MLREAGLLVVKEDEAGGELIDFEQSRAFAMADHQLSHVFVKDGDEAIDPSSGRTVPRAARHRRSARRRRARAVTRSIMPAAAR